MVDAASGSPRSVGLSSWFADSKKLHDDVIKWMSVEYLGKVDWCTGCENDFKVRVALMLQREVFAPHEQITPIKMHIIMRGVVAKAGDILTSGQYFGDIIVTAAKLRDMRPARVHASHLLASDLVTMMCTSHQLHASHQSAARLVARARVCAHAHTHTTRLSISSSRRR